MKGIEKITAGLYGMGALLMILALRYGELSVLHPMMSVGYVKYVFGWPLRFI